MDGHGDEAGPPWQVPLAGGRPAGRLRGPPPQAVPWAPVRVSGWPPPGEGTIFRGTVTLPGAASGSPWQVAKETFTFS